MWKVLSFPRMMFLDVFFLTSVAKCTGSESGFQQWEWWHLLSSLQPCCCCCCRRAAAAAAALLVFHLQVSLRKQFNSKVSIITEYKNTKMSSVLTIKINSILFIYCYRILFVLSLFYFLCFDFHFQALKKKLNLLLWWATQ